MDNELDLTKKATKADIHKGCRVAYYTALVQAWTSTSMELDKQILTLASLGLGGLIVFEQAGLQDTGSFWLWFLASIFFILSILTALTILSLNAKYISSIVSSFEEEQENRSAELYSKCLQFLDVLLIVKFLLGIIFAFILALYESNFSLVLTS